MGGRVRLLAAVLCAVSLAPGAAFAQDCAGGAAPPDRLAELAAAVEAALPGAATRAETRALVRARDALAARGASFASRTDAFRAAARALERLPGAPFSADLSTAYAGLRVDLDGEVRNLQELLRIFPGSASERAKARIAALAARADAAEAAEKIARAAADLHRAARATERARDPKVETYGGALRVISVNLDGLSEVPLNRPVVIQFSARLDPAFARADTIQVRRGPNYAAQVAGSYEVRGPMVVFRPRSPTLPDLSDSGLQGSTSYRVVIPGYPSVATVLSETGKPHAKLFTADFHTASDPNFHFTASEYLDAPPPRVDCTVPADVLPAAPWVDPSGAVQVPVASPIRLVMNRVPLHPATLTPDSVQLVMTEFRGAPASTRIAGRAVLEQDLSRVTLTFEPAVALPDNSRFALRVDRSVTDLTGAFELADHAGRSAIYTQAALEIATNPSSPLAVFAEAHPLEVDPRTFLVFTTRDEAASDLDRALAFDGTDLDVDGGDGADRTRTSASFHDAVPGAVAGTITVAGGDGRLGVFDPQFDLELDTDSPEAPGGVFHFQRIHIRPSVTVSIRGSKPAVLRSREDAVIEGGLLASGGVGVDTEFSQTTASLPLQPGGLGGPGGGAGGDSFPGPEFGMRGGTGESVLGSGTGGQGGGETASSAPYSWAGGGGGAGHATAGVPGSGGSYPGTQGWNGPGGAAGTAGGGDPSSAATDDGRRFLGTGGSGGGAGGNGRFGSQGGTTLYRTSGAGGGGGGGGLLVTTAGDLRVAGIVSAAGGNGGSPVGTGGYGGAPGGGGAGGSLAFFAAGSLDIAGGRFRVNGGSGGGGLVPTWTGLAGAGAHGFLRFEDRDGVPAGALTAVAVPDVATVGVFDPSSLVSDPPSVFLGTWFSLPAFRPTVLPFVEANFPHTLIPGAEIRWEIQMADDSPFEPGRPDLGTVDAATGASSDPDRASGWVLLKDAAGIKDVSAALNGRGFQHFRIRISFHLPDGVRAADPKPTAEGFRVRVRHQD